MFIAELFCEHLQTMTYVYIFKSLWRDSWYCYMSEFLKVWTFEPLHTILMGTSVKMVVEEVANIVGCSKTQLSLNFSITGIYNDLHSKGVSQHSAANCHHLDVFVGMLEAFGPLNWHLILEHTNKQPNKTKHSSSSLNSCVTLHVSDIFALKKQTAFLFTCDLLFSQHFCFPWKWCFIVHTYLL